jgi:hypothetical protein
LLFNGAVEIASVIDDRQLFKTLLQIFDAAPKLPRQESLQPNCRVAILIEQFFEEGKAANHVYKGFWGNV